MIGNKRKAELLADRADTLELMRELLSKAFRTPMGAYREEMMQAVRDLGKMSVETNHLIVQCDGIRN